MKIDAALKKLTPKRCKLRYIELDLNEEDPSLYVSICVRYFFNHGPHRGFTDETYYGSTVEDAFIAVAKGIVETEKFYYSKE